MEQTSFYSLQWLLAPISVDSFRKEYWEKTPLLIERSQENYFYNILNYRKIDNILSQIRFDQGDIRLAYNEEIVFEYKYLRPNARGEAFVDIDKVYDFYNGGATIVLDNFEKYCYELAVLCSSFNQAGLGPFKEVFTNIYITPKDSQAFDLHYDDQEVFILQLEGEKEWNVYNSLIPLPLEDQYEEIPKETDEAPVLSTTLRKGDLLYLPRGYMHEVRSTPDANSIHATIAVYPFTWHDFLTKLIKNKGLSEVELRKSLPFELFQSFAEGKTAIKEKLNLLTDIKDQEILQILSNISQSSISNVRPLLRNSFRLLNDEVTVTNESTLRIRSDANLEWSVTEDQLNIVINGKLVSVPSTLEVDLQFINEHKEFQISELPSKYDFDSKQFFTKKLIKEGYLEIKENQLTESPAS